MHRVRYLGLSSPGPPVNMAIDELFFSRAQKDRDAAVLRFFTFDRQCISLGRNQNIHSLPEELTDLNVDVIKRPTGGGAVLHDNDLCYGIVLPEGYLGTGKSLMDGYRRITDGIRKAFTACGLDVRFGDSDRYQHDPLCFRQALTYELSLNGRKLVGSAQRRAKGIVLQQGSISDTHRVPQDRLVQALLEGLKRSLGIQYADIPLTAEELEAARALSNKFLIQPEISPL